MSKELKKNVANTNSQNLTEQWRNGTLEEGYYYTLLNDDNKTVMINYFWDDGCFQDSCDDNIEDVLANVPDYIDCKRLMNDSIELDKAKIKIYELVSNSDELVQKVHILNEQNTKQYNELCEEIKKNNILEKKIDIATKALKKINRKYRFTVAQDVVYKALKEMKGVK